jgi:lysophospholipase L1-like esterase
VAQRDSNPPTEARFQPRQTIIFLGDHTSPDDGGYVRVISDVLARFQPGLRLNLISAGAKGQTAAALRSSALLDLLSSSRPDWLCIGLGWADVLKEPALGASVQEYRRRLSESDEGDDAAVGAEYAQRARSSDVPSMDGVVEPQLRNLEQFKQDVGDSIQQLGQAGIHCILLTTMIAGSDLRHPVNSALRTYSKAIRDVGAIYQAPIVDVERAFRDVLIRAASYKQRVALASERGEITHQGQALIARTFLHTFGVLPYPGFRPNPSGDQSD